MFLSLEDSSGNKKLFQKILKIYVLLPLILLEGSIGLATNKIYYFIKKNYNYSKILIKTNYSKNVVKISLLYQRQHLPSGYWQS